MSISNNILENIKHLIKANIAQDFLKLLIRHLLILINKPAIFQPVILSRETSHSGSLLTLKCNLLLLRTLPTLLLLLFLTRCRITQCKLNRCPTILCLDFLVSLLLSELNLFSLLRLEDCLLHGLFSHLTTLLQVEVKLVKQTLMGIFSLLFSLSNLCKLRILFLVKLLVL